MKQRFLLVLLLVLLCATAGCVTRSTDSTEVGVRTKKLALFGKAGVEDRVYPPGSTFFFLPLINDWHTFDVKLQNMEMTIDTRKGDIKARDDLLFKTVDGNDISLDVILAYRVDPKKAAYILQNVAKNDYELRGKVVRTIARSIPRDIFGELKTEDFYVASKRQAKAEKARAVLQEILNPLGVIVERVLPKDYRFNPAYQRAIEGKKVADQLVEKNKAATRAAVEEYRRKVEEAKGEVNKMVAKADGEYQQAKIMADAYYQRQVNIAKAIESEGKAEAEGIRKMNAALAGSGGKTMVKLKVAQALAGKSILLLPLGNGGINLKTTDVNDLIRLMGIRAAAGGGNAWNPDQPR